VEALGAKVLAVHDNARVTGYRQIKVTPMRMGVWWLRGLSPWQVWFPQWLIAPTTSVICPISVERLGDRYDGVRRESIVQQRVDMTLDSGADIKSLPCFGARTNTRVLVPVTYIIVS
jgi:hypothetical protein